MILVGQWDTRLLNATVHSGAESGLHWGTQKDIIFASVGNFIYKVLDF